MIRVHAVLRHGFMFIVLSAATLATSFTLAAAADTDIVINEVYYLGATANDDWIELKNTGSTTIDVSTWIFCGRFNYVFAGIGTLTLLDGADYVLEPGEIITVVPWTNLNNVSSDLGLYTSTVFTSTAAMVDFVQWGTSADVGRTDVAVAKGIWTETSPGTFDFVATAGADQSAAYSGKNGGGGLLTLSGDFTNGTTSRGQENDDPSGVAARTPPASALTLLPARPNPFSASTEIRFALEQPSDAQIGVYDIKGRRVFARQLSNLSSGMHSYAFTGHDDTGRVLPSGVYLVQINAAGTNAARKIVVIR